MLTTRPIQSGASCACHRRHCRRRPGIARLPLAVGIASDGTALRVQSSSEVREAKTLCGGPTARQCRASRCQRGPGNRHSGRKSGRRNVDCMAWRWPARVSRTAGAPGSSGRGRLISSPPTSIRDGRIDGLPLPCPLEHLNRLLGGRPGRRVPRNALSVRSADTFSATATLMTWFTATPSAFATFFASSIKDG